MIEITEINLGHAHLSLCPVHYFIAQIAYLCTIESLTTSESTMDFSVVFSDVVPIPQDDGPQPVCSIAYSAEFIEAHDILRALLKADERSERALNLTSICLKLNPANYTVWHYRRRCLIALSTSDESSNSQQNPTIDTERIEMDLDFADKLGGTK